jgi:orotidine-5'-phosphate decarboxylase
MNREQLFEQIRAKRSFLCVGLDTNVDKIPPHIIYKHFRNYLREKWEQHQRTETTDRDELRDYVIYNSILEFNTSIVDATEKYAIAYKPNMAFYEAYGSGGIDALRDTCRYIERKHPHILLIADAKRGDIGNTSDMYAQVFLEHALFDAITLSPYMGRDTVEPFLKYEDKWAVILALTSNPSADDFETLPLANGDPLWKEVLRKASAWGTADNTMFVVGATRAEMLGEVRRIVPDHFLLVPGVGAQGGSLEEVARHGMNSHCGLLVNSSRGIIYADRSEHFASAAAREAHRMASEMATLLDRYL